MVSMSPIPGGLIIPGASKRDSQILNEFKNIKVGDSVRIKPKYFDILAVSDLHPEVVKYLMAGNKNRFKVLKIKSRKEAESNPLVYVLQLLLVEHHLYFSQVELIKGSRSFKVLNVR